MSFLLTSILFFWWLSHHVALSVLARRQHAEPTSHNLPGFQDPYRPCNGVFEQPQDGLREQTPDDMFIYIISTNLIFSGSN